MKTLEKRYGQEREMRRLPVALSNGEEIKLLPGRQSVLIKKILDDLCSLYTPSGRVLYVSNTKDKWSYFDPNALRSIGVEIEEHGKMPDVVVHHVEKGWLVLIEAVTSHGPVNPKRRQELKELFAGSKIGLVFVTAFLERRAMIKYLNDISWETEVWVAESPTHLIHFNGERFLGPYED
ncbi:MAG: BsuBI/PstI family type II restriction endonuclease [Nitrospirota bacterium]